MVCGGSSLAGVIRIEGVPVSSNRLHPSAREARRAPRGDIDLVACEGCGHLFNRVFDERLPIYDVRYETSLEAAGAYRAYARSLARRLLKRHRLAGRQIVEIGCGRAEFLRLLCESGRCRGTGFEAGQSPLAGGRVRIRPETFGPHLGAVAADLLCCRHVLEHLARPLDLLDAVRRVVRAGAGLYFEVPNGLHVLRTAGVWDLIYEHRSLFWRGSLAAAFSRSGLAVERVGEAYGGQYLALEGRIPAGTGGVGSARRRPGPILDLAAGFARRAAAEVARWRRRLERCRRRSARVIAWGAGSKGVSFLNAVGAGGAVSLVVDANARKQGRFVPGSAQRVIAPEEVPAARPDLVLVMNPRYAREIRADLGRRGVGAAVVTV